MGERMSKQIIYQTLIQSGMTREAALGMMGNMQCESGLEPNRLQGDFNPFRTTSKSYVQRVTRGDISQYNFAHDQLGFGLCQWTFYTRKYDLYDFWKESGKNLDDAEMQTQFVLKEMKRDYDREIYVKDEKKWINLWQLLLKSNDIFECTKYICKIFERPTVNNIDARFRAAKQLEAELTAEPETDPEPSEPAKEIYWPPRMICKGMEGSDVAVLQAILSARGFTCEITGEFNVQTHNMTIAFQSQNQLDQDGIVGPLTWGKLLERG